MMEKKVFVGPGRDSYPAVALREIGQGLFGTTWQRDLARQLTPLHPKGKNVTQQMVARWAAGDRSIPSWVWMAMGLIFDDRVIWMLKKRDVMERLAQGREPDAGKDDELAALFEGH